MTNRIHEAIGNIMGRDNMSEAIRGERPVKSSDVIKTLVALGETGLITWVAMNAMGCAPIPTVEPGEPTREKPTLSSPEISSTPTIIGTESPYVEPGGIIHKPVEVFNFDEVLALMDSKDAYNAGVHLAKLRDNIPEIRGKRDISYYSMIFNINNQVAEGVNLAMDQQTGKSYVLTRSTGVDADGKLTMGGVFTPLNSTLIVGEQGRIKGARFDYEANGSAVDLFTMKDEHIFYVNSAGQEVLIPGSRFRVEPDNTSQLTASFGGNKLFSRAPYVEDIFKKLPPDSEVNYGKGEILGPSGTVIFTMDEQGRWNAEEQPTPTASLELGETDPMVIEKLAADLECRDARGCIHKSVTEKDAIDMDMSATGYIKPIRLRDIDGKEYATVLAAQMVTRSNDSKSPRVLWTPLQIETDKEKGKNNYRAFVQAIYIDKLGKGFNDYGTQLFDIDWFKQWIKPGSEWHFGYNEDGTPLLDIFKDSQYGNPTYEQIIKDFFSTGGEQLNVTTTEETIVFTQRYQSSH